MAKKEEKRGECKPCKWCCLLTAIVFVILGIWLWRNSAEPTALAKSFAVVLVVVGIKKFGSQCPCKSGKCS